MSRSSGPATGRYAAPTAPGGWAFEFHNDNYPDIDDTAEVVLALRRVAPPRPGAGGRRPCGAAVRWTLGMQSRNGAWAAFDADNTSPLPNRLPFCDFGEVIDPPSADVTAHVVEMLAVEGRRDDPRTRRGIDWLLAEQEPSGAWFGRWGVNYVYGTGSVVPALVDRRAARRAPRDPQGRGLAGERAERGRRLGRGPALLPRPRRVGRQGRLHRLPDRVGAARAAGGGGAGQPRRSSAASGGWPAPSGRTAPGTSRTSPAPASPGTSPSTTTCTGMVFPLTALGRYVNGRPPSAPSRESRGEIPGDPRPRC